MSEPTQAPTPAHRCGDVLDLLGTLTFTLLQYVLNVTAPLARGFH